MFIANSKEQVVQWIKLVEKGAWGKIVLGTTFGQFKKLCLVVITLFLKQSLQKTF